MNAEVRRRARRREARLIMSAALVLVLLVGGLAGYALRPTSGSSAAEGPMRVVTTTNFLDDTVRQVGGEHVRTHRLMGAGADPHLYQAKASDLDAMRSAHTVIAVGLYLEGSLQQTLTEIGKSTPVLFAAEQIPEHELLSPPADAAPEEEYDPHVWFDPRLWAYVVDAVAEHLATLDPDNAQHYQDNAARYRAEVIALSEEIRSLLDAVPAQRRTLVTSHDAFRYFGRAFDVEVAAIQGISTEEEATTADIARVAEVIIDTGVRSVFVESSVSGQTLEAVRAAVRQRGGTVELGGELYSDAAGEDGTADGTYLGMIRANAQRLVEGLA